MKLEKLARFNEELETIVLFIAEDSQSRALEFYDELIIKIEQIPLSPLIYRKREKSNFKRHLGHVFFFFFFKKSINIC